MKAVVRFTQTVSAIALMTMLPAIVGAQALPAAADVIAKYVSAIGGKDAVMKITSITQTATLEIPSMGLSAQMQMYSAAPNKMASKTDIPGVGEMLNGYNGTLAWDMNPMQGPRLLGDKELTQMKESADFYANRLYSAEQFASMTTLGDTTINGEKAFKVKLVRTPSMKESFAYFSATSGFLLFDVSTPELQMGAVQTTQTVSEYKKFGDLMFPTKIEQSMGPQKMLLTIKTIEFNNAPESAFAVPAQVQALIKK